jgi:N-acetylmuramoyl-L-alanine amidase
MRDIKYLVVHCTATDKKVRASSLLNYWKDTLGWKRPGYHVLIMADGSILNLTPINEIANGVSGYNAVSLHVSYVGGLEVDDRSPEQKVALIKVLKSWKALYPNAIIQGHRDFPGVKKACPRFNAKVEYKTLKP